MTSCSADKIPAMRAGWPLLAAAEATLAAAAAEAVVVVQPVSPAWVVTVLKTISDDMTPWLLGELGGDIIWMGGIVCLEVSLRAAAELCGSGLRVANSALGT